MTMPSVTSSLTDFMNTLGKYEQDFIKTRGQALMEIDKRLTRFSNEASDTLRQAAHQIEPLRCAEAVNRALNASNSIMVKMMRNQLAGMDFSKIAGVLWDARPKSPCTSAVALSSAVA